jgi:hypothetical protein
MIEFGWGMWARVIDRPRFRVVLWSARALEGGQVVAGAGGPQTRVNSWVHPASHGQAVGR